MPCLTVTGKREEPRERTQVALLGEWSRPQGRLGLVSEVLHPSPEFEVPLSRLREEAADCDRDRDAERCELLHALFDHGEVVAGALPAGGRLCDH